MDERERPIRILIADDHPILREGLTKLLEAEPGFAVVGEAADGEAAVELAAKVDADVLLLDLAMPRLSGLEVLDQLARSGRPLLTIILTASIDHAEIVRALQLGARGVVVKDSATGLLNRCIRTVVAGKYWIGHEGISDLVQALRQLSGTVETSPPPMTLLTSREIEIISAVVEGASNKEIGEHLGLSTQTVKNHMSSIFDKLGVSSRLELALFAVHHHLLDRAPRPE
jgi:two-component system nitrate/nitrite response regulator NarL